MEQDPLGEDAYPLLTSSPVIRKNRPRKKPAGKKSGSTNVSLEENEVTSTTSTPTPAAETKGSRGTPMKSKKSQIFDQGDVPTQIENSEEANQLEESAEENNCKMRTVATDNIKEKIVLCVDTFDDPEGSPFMFPNGKKYTTLTMIQRSLTIFLKHKNAINCEHEFAIIELDGDSACWMHDFTNDVEEVIKAVENITPNGIESTDFDFAKLFDVIAEKVIPPKVPETSRKPLPPFAIRVIVLYSRSKCIPEFNTSEYSFQLWSAFSPNRFLDTLYIHENPDDNNNCKQIHENLHSLETDSSYSFQVVRSASDLHNCMAKLLAHPLQRADGSRAGFKLEAGDLGRNGTS